MKEGRRKEERKRKGGEKKRRGKKESEEEKSPTAGLKPATFYSTAHCLLPQGS